jgi:hypothetical protein
MCVCVYVCVRMYETTRAPQDEELRRGAILRLLGSADLVKGTPLRDSSRRKSPFGGEVGSRGEGEVCVCEPVQSRGIRVWDLGFIVEGGLRVCEPV